MIVVNSKFWTAEFSKLKLFSPQNTRDFSMRPLELDGGDLLRTIRQSTFTSGLYSESTDSRHLFSVSDGPDLLRLIRRLRFTSTLRLFGLREFQLLIENSRSNFSVVHDPLPRIPLDTMVEIYFGYPDLWALGISNLKLLNDELPK
jgi:hypothetical protein